MWNFFTQGRVGRYLDDWVMEDEVFTEQDQLLSSDYYGRGRLTAKSAVEEVVLQPNQLGKVDDYQNYNF